MKLVAVAVALSWLGWIAVRREFSRHYVLWAIFCVGMISVMLLEVFGTAITPIRPALVIASCASCSVFWLVTRSLFRHNPPIQWPQMAIVAGVFFPSIFDQLALAFGLGSVIGEASLSLWMERLDGMQIFFSSTALVLAFGEGLNGWSGISDTERHVRYVFLASFGAGVVACVLLLDHGRIVLISEGVSTMIQGVCAVMIMASISAVMIYRRHHPLPLGSSRKAAPATHEDRALGRRIKALVAEGAYLDPDLKVSTLAHRLHEKDYRVSRAIVAGLGQPNFNRFINRYRIEHAQQLLCVDTPEKRSILDIALESGFASLGPFNRAFREQTGQTPRDFRRSAPDSRHAEPLAAI
tara:strand:- start:746 stop:1804 length:1059 start_codon:yes stop_codon:yes gene_type:complete